MIPSIDTGAKGSTVAECGPTESARYESGISAISAALSYDASESMLSQGVALADVLAIACGGNFCIDEYAVEGPDSSSYVTQVFRTKVSV